MCASPRRTVEISPRLRKSRLCWRSLRRLSRESRRQALSLSLDQTRATRLDEIGSFIAAENPAAAARAESRIVTAVDRLAHYPHSGRAGRLNNTRELVLADIPYVVPYLIVGDRVQIITVFHAAKSRPPTR